MEKKLIKSIFLRFKTNNIRLKIQCPQGRAGSTPAAGIYNLNIFEVYFFRKSSPLANNFILKIRILFLNNFFKTVIIVKYILKGSYLYE